MAFSTLNSFSNINIHIPKLSGPKLTFISSTTSTLTFGFTAPDGTITSTTPYVNSVAGTGSGSPSSYTITGLTTANTDYSITLSVTTNIGTTTYSAVTMTTSPIVPTVYSASNYGSTKATFYYVPITQGGSYAVTYTLTGLPGQASSTFSNNVFTISGLSPSTTYSLNLNLSNTKSTATLTTSITTTSGTFTGNSFGLATWCNQPYLMSGVVIRNGWSPMVYLSTSGQYGMAISGGNIYVSSDYGQSWTLKNVGLYNAGQECRGAISGTGQYMYTCGNNSSNIVSYTTNYGVTWASLSTRVETIAGQTYINSGYSPNGFACDNTGQYVIFASKGNGMFYSNNYGITWYVSNYNSTVIGNASYFCTTLAMSLSGAYILAAWNAIAGATTGQLIYSTDYGQNWTAITGLPFNVNRTAQGGLAMDSTGTNVVCALYNSTAIYYSSNGGLNWTLSTVTNPPVNYGFPSMDATGQYVLVPANNYSGGYGLFYSTNYGQSFTRIPGIVNNTCMGATALSSDARYAIAISGGNLAPGVIFTQFA
jgi:hypothetical protein